MAKAPTVNRSPRAKKQPAPPAGWALAPYTKADAIAIQAVDQGVAEPDQQKRALNWIINQAALTYDLPYRPGGEDGRRDTDFACGRAFVGHQIVKLTKMNATLAFKDE